MRLRSESVSVLPASMRRGWRGTERGDSGRSKKVAGNAFFQASPAAEFSQTLPRQFRPQTEVVANRPPRMGPIVPPRAQENKAKASFGWREARVGASIQKSNSLTNIGNCSQSLTERQPNEAEEGSRPLARRREVVSGRNHAGIRRSASLRSLLANTGEYHLFLILFDKSHVDNLTHPRFCSGPSSPLWPCPGLTSVPATPTEGSERKPLLEQDDPVPPRRLHALSGQRTRLQLQLKL